MVRAVYGLFAFVAVAAPASAATPCEALAHLTLPAHPSPAQCLFPPEAPRRPAAG